ncbi:MAG: hypothetical protein ACXABY_13630 [Candidatus Thorarchaeota archaeon]|jgi:hypothetical protein
MNFNEIELSPNTTAELNKACAFEGVTTPQAKRALLFFMRGVKLLDAKQKDYGPDNINKGGHTGILTRMTDKIERLKNLDEKKIHPDHADVINSVIGQLEGVANNPLVADQQAALMTLLGSANPANESVEDSLVDNANYSAIDYQLINNTWNDQ